MTVDTRYTEKEFIDIIEYATGKKLGKDFGFIDGNCSPYPKSGMSSAAPREGFMVWRKEGDLTSEFWIKPGTQVQYIKTIIEFLLRDIVTEFNEAMDKVELRGEYDSPNK